ncbi:hypothetical protein HPB48_011413 [Haemaphysalis longicornis]|uniref:chitinase n=1 Tax=Haemaphysalis longicornis TaxID=44386 RepID=A0A9J6FRA4_HAELO|nr:hypothetical protein HPB48_011413 [Haemaphysalis longicornis]
MIEKRIFNRSRLQILIKDIAEKNCNDSRRLQVYSNRRVDLSSSSKSPAKLQWRLRTMTKSVRAADFLNLLTYDYHTAYESSAQHHAPLGAAEGLREWDEESRLNVRWTVDYYLENGAPRNKLVVGVPTYGRSYTLEDIEDNELEAPAQGPGEPGNSTREKGYLAYYEICQNVNERGWDLGRPEPKRMGPYAFKDDQWVGFDDEQMIREKARYILSKRLAGAMVWTVDNDDFRGQCGGEQSPLITALRKALLGGETNNDAEEQQEAASTLRTTTKPPSSRQERVAKSSLSPGRSRPNLALSVTTPPPPPTPDPGPAFECEDEGFFNNPRDCRKYFWCLDSGPANLGTVAHAFTCPSGLYFNSKSEACDYKENVVCRYAPSGMRFCPVRDVACLVYIIVEFVICVNL